MVLPKKHLIFGSMAGSSGAPATFVPSLSSTEFMQMLSGFNGGAGATGFGAA